jgi:hypothetical protein
MDVNRFRRELYIATFDLKAMLSWAPIPIPCEAFRSRRS